MVDSYNSLETLYLTRDINDKPPNNTQYLRLYGHYCCPFVERVKLTLAAKSIPYQNVEMDLSVKKQWHLDINGGFIPIIELTCGKVINDSMVILEYLEDAYLSGAGYPLLPREPVERAKLRMALSLIDEVKDWYYATQIKKGKLDEEEISAFK